MIEAMVETAIKDEEWKRKSATANDEVVGLKVLALRGLLTSGDMHRVACLLDELLAYRVTYRK